MWHVLINLYALILDVSMVILVIFRSALWLSSSKNKSLIHLSQINSVHSKRRISTVSNFFAKFKTPRSLLKLQRRHMGDYRDLFRLEKNLRSKILKSALYWISLQSRRLEKRFSCVFFVCVFFHPEGMNLFSESVSLRLLEHWSVWWSVLTEVMNCEYFLNSRFYRFLSLDAALVQTYQSKYFSAEMDLRTK